MRRSPFIVCLGLAPLVVASCSDSSSKPSVDSGLDTGKDLAFNVADLVPDLPSDLPPDLPADKVMPPPDLPYGIEVGLEAGGAEAGPASEVGAEVAGLETGAVDRPQSCLWQKSGGRYALRHFTFGLTTPDGQAQALPNIPTTDGGAQWPIHDFEGVVTKQAGNQLTVDSCDPSLPCQPSPYRFVVCEGAYGGCSAVDSGAAIAMGIPVGRRVHVVWHLDNDVPGFCPGLYFLAVYDAEPGRTRGNVLFVGSGGRSASTGSGTPNPLSDLPFSVATEPLHCGGEKPEVAIFGDDYRFVFTPKSGAGMPLLLETGQSGAFDVAAPQGGLQRLQLHCVVAVQPQYFDDYWNWDFWGTGETSVSPVDGGTGG
jgi:hypothetical protein